jgi:parvulin-like peptidyl-prolyl isomerase
MVDDQLYLQEAERMELDVSDAAVEAFTLQQFAPEGIELTTPIPEPTMIPERAVWATETAEAEATRVAKEVATPADGTPVPWGSPVAELATPIDHEEGVSQATNDFAQFQDRALDDARMSLNEYYGSVARPELARELVNAHAEATVPQSIEQVNASHILVSTEDLARELYQRATGGADFSQLARSNSIDTTTAPTGGELGWFTYEQMVEPFSEVAFSTDPGSISKPVETQFGWHIVMVHEHDDDRAMTDLQYQQARQRAVTAKQEELRASREIETDFDVIPTPTPTPDTFFPPADAPTPIPATPVPGTPGATPVVDTASPVIEGPVLTTPEG